MASYGFHSEAAEEYLAATQYYLDHASPLVAAAFVAEVAAAICSDNGGGDRRAADSSLLTQAVSIFNLLSLGVGPSSRLHLRSDALQSASRLLA